MTTRRLRALNAQGACFATTLALALLPAAAAGAAINWVPDADGFWDVAANWSSNTQLPGAADDVTINVGGAVVRLITHRTGTTTIRTINNAETVEVTNPSTLQISSGGLASTNTGTLRANNGTLNLINSALNNAGGTLSAINGGRINLSSGTSITGGTLSTDSTGFILTAVGSTATLNGVTLASGAQFVASNASSTTLIGTITNAGTITLSSAGNLTNLILSGNVTFAGTGLVSMGNNINNRIYGAVGTERLTNAAGHTIQGAGQIGVNLMAITNAGTIVANQPTVLVIDPNAAGGLTNTGSLRADGGTLQLAAGSYTNTGGTIDARDGSVVQLLTGAVISGGTLTTSGTGVITATTNQAPTLNGVTITSDSQYVGGNASSTVLVGTITNNGTIALNSGGSLTNLILSGDVTLGGGGAVVMSNNGLNRIYGDAGGERLTNAAGHVIQGSGQIGVDRTAITNAGLIVANQSNALVIDPLAGAGNAVNTGTLRADGGTLQLGAGSYTNTGGTIEARNGSAVQLLNGAVINGGTLSTSTGGVITATTNQAPTLNGVTISSGSQYVGGNASATVLAGTITNNGTMSLASSGSITDFILSGDVTLTGPGVMTFGNNYNNRIYGSVGNERLTNALGHTIQGSGRIGENQMAITNAGLIVANQTTMLFVDPGAGGLLNTGTLRATNNATLQLGSGGYDNINGTIEAQNGSVVELTANAAITGGTLTTSGTGVIRTGNNHVVTLNGVTLTSGSQFVGNNGSVTVLNGTITNNGTMSLASTGSATDFQIAGDVTLTGPGVLALGNNLQNRIFGQSQSGTERLTNAAGHTIQGSGQIGAGRLLITNEGLIVATQSTPLLMQVMTGAGDMINTGTLRADGGTLQLAGGTYTNSGGIIEALNGSVVELGATVVGGTLSTDATGVISASFGATLRDVTNAADLRLVNGAPMLLYGTITNNRTIALNSTGSVTDMVLGGDVTLTGPGTLTMSNNGNNRIFGGVTHSEVLTNAAGHTIRGAGQIGIGQMGLNNQGLIIADQSAGLTIATAVGATSINTGTLRAAGGLLTISTTTLDNAVGLIEAVGSNIRLANTTIIGGTLASSAGGQIEMQSSTLQDLTNAGQVAMLNGAFNSLRGTITNEGMLLMNSSGSLTQIGLSGDVTLVGPGTLTMSNNGNNQILGASTRAEVLINSAGHTIQGAGQIGANLMGLNNQGLILANQSVGLVIDLDDVATTTRINTGTLRAAGGQLTIQSTALNNTGGTIDAAGSHVLLSGSTISGGTLQSSGGGEIRMQSGATLANLTNTGQVRMINANSNFLQGTVTNNGAMLLDSAGSQTNLIMNGNVTLAGTGALTLSNNVNNRIFGIAPSDVLTNAAGHTIQGGGQLGVDLMGLNNQGLILANQSTALTINTSSPIVNSGTLQANNVLTLVDAVNNSGTILANGGTVNANAGFTGATGTARLEGAGSIVVGAASSVGNLLHNGTGALALGANSITVHTDYNNANFGTGNGFNARANVTGTGQILAAGNVTQALTGTNITNGATGTATLTIGNVRVGATTFNYQIANTGTTGPALRGALQTSVNGGNLTDVRLSGTGVTASNWGPIATGASTGNLNVTFTAASAGALAPLTGQVVHIANNFGNVGAQNLNIVLGAGAAAYNLAAGSATPSPVTIVNQRVGGTTTQALTVTNTAPAGSFTEGLNASFVSAGGDAQHNGGTINLLAGGASNNSSMNVSVNTAAAGAKSGTVTLGYVSDGTGTSELGLIGVGTQVINVSGNVYQIAQPNVPTTVNLGNVHVGGNLSQAISIGNTLNAPVGFQEGLNATVGGTTGGATGTGSITNLAAGSSSNAVSVGLNGIAAGNQSGTVTLNLASNGAGTSGLGVLDLAPSTVTVNATGYNLAAGSAAPSPVTLANQRVGGTNTQALTVTNTAAAGAFTEDLNATFGANTGAALNNGGAVNLLAGGASNGAAMNVRVDTTTAGAKSGTVTLNYVSDGAGTSGLGQTGVGSQTINVSGNVYQVAQPAIGTTVALANQRVGGTLTQGVAITNTSAAPNDFQEGLDVNVAGSSGAASGTGSIANLAQGQASNSAIQVGVNTATSGAKTGTVTLGLASNGTGTSGLATLALGPQTVNVGGNVYQVASGAINTAPLNFGTVQVGQNVSQVLSISNTATGAAGFVEDLNASFGGTSGTGAALISGTGSFTGLVAGGTNNSAMTVTVNTSAAGTVDGAIAVNFVSAGTVNGTSNGLGTLNVGSQNYGVQGLIQANVINTASPVINNSPINLGNVRVGATSPTAFVSVTNQATTPPQAALNATITGNAPITASGSFNLLLPGQTNANSLQVGMNTGAAGAINGTATLAFVSDASNVGGCEPNCQLNLPSQNVTVTGGVYQVAQPNVPASVNLGNFRIGNAPTQTVAISNTNVAPAGFQEGLDASISGTTGQATATGGPITNLGQGGTSNAISVGINNGSANAGINTGTVTLALASNGSGTSGLTTLNLPAATIDVTATGYNAAAGNAAPSPIVLANQRVGGTASQVLTITNTAPAGAFSEDLNAGFGANGGNATSTGSIAGRLAGTNNTGTGTMTVGLDTSAAGARSGTVTVNYQTAGAVNGASNGLGTASVGSQVINVSGNVYQVAAGQIQTAPLNFGTVQVGQVVSRDLVIRNTATGAAGFVEDLNASFGAAGDARISGSGLLNNILAGTDSTSANGTMTVSVNTSAAGSIASSIAVNFASAGAVNGVSNGLGTLGVGSANYGVSGVIQANVIDTAQPVTNGIASPNPVAVNLGNVRINTAANQTLTVLNQATGNQQAQLNASISSNGAPVTAAGSFNGLLPGQTDNTSLQVGMDTGTAGARSGSATIAFVSDASNIGNCAPNCELNLPSQTVNVSANVYRLANPVLNTGTVTVAARVGDAVGATQAVSISNASPDLYTEGLKVNVTGASGNAQHNSGSIANLAAQGTDGSTIRVGLASTATAGTTSGQVQLGYTSTGAGTTNAADLGVGSGTVTVTGKVYTPAQAQIASTTIDFGIVHVGDAVGPIALNVSNVAPATALNDTLKASFGAVSGPFSGSGSIAGIAAGGSDASSMKVGLNTATAGVFNGAGSVDLASHNDDMTDLALTPTALILSAQVNNYANPVFIKTGGAGSLTRSGDVFSLDLGDLIVGSGTTSADLAVLNDVFGPADLVDGSFDLSGVNDFSLAGFGAFTNLGAGDLFDSLLASLIASSIGSFDDTIVLNAFAHNASGYSQQLTLTLLLHADVLQSGAVPEPAGLALLLIALTALGWSLRRGRRAGVRG